MQKIRIMTLVMIAAASLLVAGCGTDEIDGEQTWRRGGTLVEPEEGTRQTQAWYTPACFNSKWAGFCHNEGYCANGKFYRCNSGEHCAHVSNPNGGTMADCVGGSSSSWSGGSKWGGQNDWSGGCGGLSYVGECIENKSKAVWCENGQRREKYCGAGNCYKGIHGVCHNQYCAACGPPVGGSGPSGNAWGKTTGCSWLGWKGKCDGNTAKWCENGTVREMHCGNGCYMGRHGVCGGACCAACGPPANGGC